MELGVKDLFDLITLDKASWIYKASRINPSNKKLESMCDAKSSNDEVL